MSTCGPVNFVKNLKRLKPQISNVLNFISKKKKEEVKTNCNLPLKWWGSSQRKQQKKYSDSVNFEQPDHFKYKSRTVFWLVNLDFWGKETTVRSNIVLYFPLLLDPNLDLMKSVRRMTIFEFFLNGKNLSQGKTIQYVGPNGEIFS